MRFSHIHLSLAVVLFVLTGCTSRPFVIERPQPMSRTDLLAKLGARGLHWSSYQANVHIRAQSAKGKYRLRAVIVARLPGQFRLEAFTPMGQTAGILVFGSRGASLWIPSEQVIYSSDRAETLIEHFLGVPVPLETFGYSLAASMPPGFQPGDLDPVPLDAGWTLSSTDRAKGLSFTWYFLSRPPALKAVTVGEGPLRYTIDYEPATTLDPDQIPGEIRFVSPQWQMEIKIDQMKPSHDIQESAFNPAFPAGIRRVELGR
jgi:hypothetical protein